MSAVAEWAGQALLGTSALMLFVLAVRIPVRRWIGPGAAYALWVLPVARMVLPPLPTDPFAILPPVATADASLSVIIGPRGIGLWEGASASQASVAVPLLAAWLFGAIVFGAVHVTRHVVFRRRLLASATELDRRGAVRIIATAVNGPLAFGVVRRFVAVPRDFATLYDARERELALAHECAHHARGDLIANWVALAMLAAHWWNPIAWAAMRAFRDDQEFAVDASVLTRGDPGTRADYARVLAKAAGLGALPACNLNPRSNLKGRLMMLARTPATKTRLMLGGGALATLAVAALAATVSVSGATASPVGRQAVTIGVKPDGAGGHALIVGGAAVAPGAPLPGDATLPADLSPQGGCDLNPSAKPSAMVIKGGGDTTTYTVMCASARPMSIAATLSEGLTSLKSLRGMVATQPATAVFPEVERTHALGAIDRSIREVESALAPTR